MWGRGGEKSAGILFLSMLSHVFFFLGAVVKIRFVSARTGVRDDSQKRNSMFLTFMYDSIPKGLMDKVSS